MDHSLSITMELRDLSTQHRAKLFSALSEQQSGDSDWDQVFALMRHGQQVAERADLGDLAEQFAAGQELVIDELKKGGQFYDWELQFMQLGMATGALSAVYDRIAAHYRLLGAFLDELRKNLLLPVLIMLSVVVGLPIMGVLQGTMGLYQAAGNVVLALIPGVLLVCAVPLTLVSYRSGWLPQPLRRAVFHLPGVGNLLARYQTFHFLSHLNLCVAAGFSVTQALKQSARRMPPTPMKSRFLSLYKAVSQGSKLSAALQQSRLIRGVTVPSLEAGATAQDAQLALTRAVYEDCVAQAAFWTRAMPWLLLALLPYVALINAWSL